MVWGLRFSRPKSQFHDSVFHRRQELLCGPRRLQLDFCIVRLWPQCHSLQCMADTLAAAGSDGRGDLDPQFPASPGTKKATSGRCFCLGWMFSRTGNFRGFKGQILRLVGSENPPLNSTRRAVERWAWIPASDSARWLCPAPTRQWRAACPQRPRKGPGVLGRTGAL